MGALRDFVSEVLETEGSAVEAVEPDGLEVLAPEPLRTAMGWPELVRKWCRSLLHSAIEAC